MKYVIIPNMKDYDMIMVAPSIVGITIITYMWLRRQGVRMEEYNGHLRHYTVEGC